MGILYDGKHDTFEYIYAIYSMESPINYPFNFFFFFFSNESFLFKFNTQGGGGDCR